MFINKTKDGRNDQRGRQVMKYRKELGKSQRELADLLQLSGLDVDKNAVQRIEAGKRFVTDIKLFRIARVLNVTMEQLVEAE